MAGIQITLSSALYLNGVPVPAVISYSCLTVGNNFNENVHLMLVAVISSFSSVSFFHCY